MIDDQVVAQLAEHFANLKSDFVFAVAPSRHEHQGELLELLNGVASASPRIRVEEAGAEVPAVQFDILRNGAPTGIRFRGVPGGHEFTTLVLALLNADGLGKQPDPALQSRVKALQGPVGLRTYVSLSCTNCPDVVQALNLMALLHEGITNEMVDGGLHEAEIAEFGVQAVPTVYANGKLVHVGRSSFGELLDVLEEHFGRTARREAGGNCRCPGD